MLLAGAGMLVSGAGMAWAADCGDDTPPATDTPCACGDRVTSDTTLDATDPVVDPLFPCLGDGLIVASGVNLDLGGETITGSDSASGLRLQGSGGSVAHGRIRGFAFGINSDGTISGWKIVPPGFLGIRVTGNGKGIDINANLTQIRDIAASLNEKDGVVVHGDSNLVSRLSCSRNGDEGIVVIGDNNTVEHNVCDKNGGKGIVVVGDDNTLVRNYGTGNAGTGVLGVGDGNDFQTNRATNNGGDGVIGKGTGLNSNGRNYGTGNRGGTNCHIDGFPTTGGGRYC
jgi:hypothetical protein